MNDFKHISKAQTNRGLWSTYDKNLKIHCSKIFGFNKELKDNFNILLMCAFVQSVNYQTDPQVLMGNQLQEWPEDQFFPLIPKVTLAGDILIPHYCVADV